MSKLAIVGCEASGKTVFMSALCDFFRTAIVPENAAANRFARFATRQLRSLRQWPPATPPGKAVEMNFSLREGGHSLMDLGLLEFGGETFRAAFRDEESAPAHKRAVEDLLDFLGDADFILVLVSLRELFRDPGDTPQEEFERDTESIWVTRGLLEFIRENTPSAHVLIGLTQADRYRRELEERGGPASAFATCWPSIRAVAPDLPVVAVASVSATDDDGRPRAGFTTDGILPVLREFAREQYGTLVNLHLALSSSQKTLDAAFADPQLAFVRINELSRQIKRYSAAIDALKAVHALVREPVSGEVASAEGLLANYERKLREFRAKMPRRKSSRRKPRTTYNIRRALLLTLLLASVLYFADTYRPHRYIRKLIPVQSRLELTVPQKSDVTHSVIREKTDADTARASAPHEPQPVAKPKPENCGTVLGNGKPAAETGGPAFRVWHDHKGTPITAKWIATSEDRRSITLETQSGKRLKAVLYKFSEADREYVLEQLEATRRK